MQSKYFEAYQKLKNKYRTQLLKAVQELKYTSINLKKCLLKNGIENKK